MRDARERLLKRCRETIAPLAVNVDRDARFPEESLTALREERLLAAAFPEDLGGSGATLTELVELCETTARACASTGMVLAMHFIQALCICQHGRRQPFFANYAAHAAREQLLLASATSEEGVDGNMRASIAAIREAPPRFSLAKRCTTVSYGEHADALLITARRSESASPSDQVIVLLRKADFRAQLLRPWNTLGMRGTCSPAMLIEAEAALEQIFETPFHVIASQTMTPAAHLLWSSVWLGIAGDALDRTMRLVRSRTHATAPGERLGRSRLLETVATFSRVTGLCSATDP
ncbi:MAG: acyl-CoA dehydrogenase family protein [Gammaproteobacteria bacterium]